MHIIGKSGRQRPAEEEVCVGRSLPEALFSDLRFGRDGWHLAAAGSAATLRQVPAVFSIGNGFIGVRGPGKATKAPRVYLNNVYEHVPIAYHEAAHGYARTTDLRLAVADATRPALLLNGLQVVAETDLELDLSRGVRTETLYVGGEKVCIEQFASMSQTALVLTRVSFPATVELVVKPCVTPPPGSSDAVAALPGIETIYDPRIAPEIQYSPWVEQEVGTEAGLATRTDRLLKSGMGVACAMQEIGRRTVDSHVQVDFVSGYRAGRDGPLRSSLLVTMTAAAARGYDDLLVEQAVWFSDFWSASAVSIPHQPEAELAIRYALAELVMAVGRDGKSSVGAKGQTGEGYEGHVFWDADLYVLPVFAFTQPAIARAMLEWRISGLDAARDNARAMGQTTGALYPWRTIGGHECSSYFPAGSAQYHINADIAFALQTYLEATGDRTILAAGGAEMAVETARIWLSIGFHDPARRDAFVINRVTGPDEYSAIVDNNLYTNLMAARHLRFAAREGVALSLIDDAESARMLRAAQLMTLPFDEPRQIYAQDDGYFRLDPWPFETTPAANYPLLLHYHPLAIYRRRVSKQADAVLALALLPHAFDGGMRQRMLETYEATTTHDSTLSASAFATAAAHAGDGRRAAHYWRVAALTDLCDLFGNTDHGLHMAALAGSWTTLAMGFARMRVDGDVLCFDPVEVPGLREYSFTVAFRGALVEVSVAGTEARVALHRGGPIRIAIAGVEAPFAADAAVREAAGR